MLRRHMDLRIRLNYLLMAAIFAAAIVISMLNMSQANAQTTTTSTDAVADTYVHNANGGTAVYGGASTLWATNNLYTAFLRFDASSSVPLDATVESIDLTLQVQNNSAQSSGVRVYAMSGDWNETTTNYANSATARQACSGTPVVDSTATPGNNTSLNLSLPLESVSMTGDTNFCITYSAVGSQFRFSSREGTHAPKLNIAYQETVLSEPVDSSFDPAIDLYTDVSQPSANYNSSYSLKGSASTYRTFLRYDLSQVIPEGATYDSVTFRPYTSFNASAYPGVAVRVVDNNWDGTGTYTSMSAQRAQCTGSTVNTNSISPAQNTYSDIDLSTASIPSDRIISLCVTYTASGSGYTMGSRESAWPAKLNVSWREEVTTPEPEAPESSLFTFTDPELDDSSGWAVSHRSAKTWWTHEDRTNQTGELWALNENGGTISKVTPIGAGVTHIDIEDMAIATIGGTPYVYLADNGGNIDYRNSINVSRFVEPTAETLNSDSSLELPAESWSFLYPASAEINTARTIGLNSETILVDPSDGRMYFILKDNTGLNSSVRSIFASPVGASATPGTYTLERVGTFAVSNSLATGASFAPDGSAFVVRDYMNKVYYYDLTGRSVTAALTAAPTYTLTPTTTQYQGEGVSFSADGKALELSTEKDKVTPAPQQPVTRVLLPSQYQTSALQLVP